MEVLKTPPVSVSDEKLMFSVIKAAFGQRRKTLRNALSAWFTAEELAALDVRPEARAETLPVEAFVRLAQNVPERA